MAERRPVVGYEGLYEVSCDGLVYSLSRIVYSSDNKRLYTKVEKVLSFETTKTGYHRVILCKEGKSRKIFVHRLVCEAFIQNPGNKPFVNHKDGVKLNNRLSNLEWCTAKENTKHAIEQGLQTPKIQKTNIPDNIKQEVKKYYIKGSSTRGCVATGNKFGIGKQTVLNIVNGG